MKKVSVLVLTALCLTGCWTRIWTVAPTQEPVVVTHQTTPVTEQPTVVVVEQPAQPMTYPTTQPTTTVYTTQPSTYTTTVTTPTNTTTVSTFTVTNYNTDPCFYLDLNAVAAAFAESRSTREFEQLLNSGRYMINNLDLNHDGWVDYLRVIETSKGYYHAALIQACLAPGIFQDVATVVAERRSDVLYVEVVGDRYLYGYNYIVRPVFIKRPPMWDAYGYSSYSCWSSPYYYDYYPSYYTKPQPVYLNHYQAYVNTYLSNHQYCHNCTYPDQPFYNGYTQMTQPYSRNDFREQHPDNSFERRVTRTANGNQAVASARNAGQLRTEVNRQSGSSRVNGTTNANTSTSSTTTSTNKTSSSSATTTTTTTSSGSSRSTGTTRSTTSTSSTTPASSTSSSSSSSATTRQPNTQRQPTTTVETRVNRSGESRTTIKQTDAEGRTQTVKRESSASSRPQGATSTRTSENTNRSTEATRSSEQPARSTETRSSGSSRR